MAKSLETIAEDTRSLDDSMPPVLDYFTREIKDKKRREEIKRAFERTFSRYVDSLRKYAPVPRRATLLEQAYHLVPEEKEAEGRDPKEILNRRIYANPGRQYPYLNGIVGNTKKTKGLKYELGRAAQYTIKEGWPVLGAGTGWWLANRWYTKGAVKGLAGRLKGAFNKKWWQYITPGAGQLRTGADAGQFLAKEGLRKLWGMAKTPLMYAICAYAAYKTIAYFIKRRKEKRLEHEEVEKLERIRNDMLLQNQMMYGPEQPVLGAA